MTYSQEVYNWRKSLGVCTRCGKEKARPGKTTCLLCMDKMNTYSRERYYQLKDKVDFTQLRRDERKKKKEQGICYTCNKPVYKNHSYCYEHYLYQKRYHRQYDSQNRNYYNLKGKCRICGEDVFEGHKLCEVHYRQYAERMREYNYSRKKGDKNVKDKMLLY